MNQLKASTYKGAIKGFDGKVEAILTIEDGALKKVDAEYTPNTIEELVVERLKQIMTKKHSIDVKPISGAGGSSKAFLSAAQKAWAVYKGKLSKQQALDAKVKSPSRKGKEKTEFNFTKASQPKVKNTSPVEKPIFDNENLPFDKSYDVVIVGSGGAGLSAAIEAAKAGMSVLICEKSGIPGGSTNYSGGVIQAAGTKYQRKLTKYQDDTPEKHAKYWLTEGENCVDPKLVYDLANNAPKNIEWLAKLGIKWDSLYGNSHVPYAKNNFADRIHVYKGGGAAGSGVILTKVLLKAALNAGAKIAYDSPVISLIQDNYTKEILGVVINQNGQKNYLKANRGIVLACASIDHNPALAKDLSPQHFYDLMHHSSMSASSDTGDGILLGLSVGAAIAGIGGCIDLDARTGNAVNNQIPTIPSIFVNGQGKRFVCEDATYAYTFRAIFQQEKQLDKHTYMIFDQNSIVQKGSPWSKNSLDLDIKKGLIKKASSIQELAKIIKVPLENITETLQTWNSNAKNGIDPEFKRKTGIKPINSPFYVYQNKAANLGALGGLKINVNGQVLDNFNQPVTNLYAAGLNAGGWIGPYYPGSGTAVSGIINQGRKVGKYLDNKKVTAK